MVSETSPIPDVIEPDRGYQFIFNMDVTVSGCTGPSINIKTIRQLSITSISSTGNSVGYLGRLELSFDEVNWFSASKTLPKANVIENIMTQAPFARIVTQQKSSVTPAEIRFHVTAK